MKKERGLTDKEDNVPYISVIVTVSVEEVTYSRAVLGTYQPSVDALSRPVKIQVPPDRRDEQSSISPELTDMRECQEGFRVDECCPEGTDNGELAEDFEEHLER